MSQKGGHLVKGDVGVNQVLGKSVSEGVAGAVLKPGLVGIFGDQVVDPWLTEGATLAQKELVGSILSPFLKIVGKGLAGLVVQGNGPCLITLPVSNM